jgi:hypothetical protein
VEDWTMSRASGPRPRATRRRRAAARPDQPREGVRALLCVAVGREPRSLDSFNPKLAPMNPRTKLVLFLNLLASLSSGQVPPAIEWQKCFGGSDRDWFVDIERTADGGYIMAGSTLSNDGDVSGNNGNTDYWIVKIDEQATLQWQVTLGGSDEDEATAIEQTADGGYVVGGWTKSNDGDVTGQHGSADCWIVKLNAAGAIEWQKTLGGTGLDEANGVLQTSDGGYAMIGRSYSVDGDVTGGHGATDVWLVKLDGNGTLQWQKALGGSDSDNGRSLVQTDDGGFVIAASTSSLDGDVTGLHGESDYWIVRTDAVGTIVWEHTFGGTDDDYPRSIEPTTDDGYLVAGYSRSTDFDVIGNDGGADFWLLEVDSNGDLQWQSTLGGTSGDDANSMVQCTGGTFVAAGYTYSEDGDVTWNNGFIDSWVVKLNASGSLVWEKSLGGTMSDVAYTVLQTLDNGFIVAGYTFSNNGDVTGNHGDMDFWIVKLAPDGTGIVEVLAPSMICTPNPTHGLVSVTFDEADAGTTLVVTNLLGSEMLRQRMTGARCNLDLRATPPGVYMVTARSNHGVAAQRLVVE